MEEETDGGDGGCGGVFEMGDQDVLVASLDCGDGGDCWKSHWGGLGGGELDCFFGLSFGEEEVDESDGGAADVHPGFAVVPEEGYTGHTADHDEADVFMALSCGEESEVED